MGLESASFRVANEAGRPGDEARATEAGRSTN